MVTDLQTHNATNADVENLCRIYVERYDTLERAKKHVTDFLEYHGIRLAYVEGKLVGILFWMQREEAKLGLAEIVDFWVEESYRRGGTGKRLLQESIREMKNHYSSQGHFLKRVFLITSEESAPARSLYEKLGFRVRADLGHLHSKAERDIVYVYEFDIGDDSQ